jgi:hypothetical protein
MKASPSAGKSGNGPMRIVVAFRWFFSILFGTGYDAVMQLEKGEGTPAPTPVEPVVKLEPEPEKQPEPAPVVAPEAGVDPSEGALRLLAVLQEEGRLLDFFLENIDEYQDDQVGAAVRQIHRDCQKSLKERFAFEAIQGESEGSRVDVDAGYDSWAIRVTGNVVGNPPYNGVLQHHGWRAGKVQLPEVAEERDLYVVAPAEVEV